MVVIRLARFGAKNNPKYRVTVADKKYSATKRFLEVIGQYDPFNKEKSLKLDMDRVNYWVKAGAQPSETVRTLIRRFEKAAK